LGGPGFLQQQLLQVLEPPTDLNPKKLRKGRIQSLHLNQHLLSTGSVTRGQIYYNKIISNLLKHAVPQMDKMYLTLNRFSKPKSSKDQK